MAEFQFSTTRSPSLISRPSASERRQRATKTDSTARPSPTRAVQVGGAAGRGGEPAQNLLGLPVAARGVADRSDLGGPPGFLMRTWRRF